MQLFALRCPGCDEDFQVRLGVGPSSMTRFYLPCPHCSLPIRGRYHGQEPNALRVEFEALRLHGEEVPNSSAFVTVDPTVPSKYSDAQRGQLGTFQTQTLLWLAGPERATELFASLSRGRAHVDERWPKVRRLYEYYLVEDWPRFDRAGEAAFKDWTPSATAHERATSAHHAVGKVLAAIVDDIDESTGRFTLRFLMKHTAALKESNYLDSLRNDLESGLITALQRSVFDVLDRFIAQFDAWHLGVLPRVMPQDNLPLLDGLTLFRDEFDVLRDLYQQGFETVCKTLRFAVAAQNTVKRSDPNDFGDVVPAETNRKTNPTTLKKYDSMSNADRLAYVRQVPGWEGFTGLLDNKMRNAIGHASARHDLRTGRILSDKNPGGITYLDLVTDTFGVFDALAASLQVLRAVRVASSPEFEDS